MNIIISFLHQRQQVLQLLNDLVTFAVVLAEVLGDAVQLQLYVPATQQYQQYQGVGLSGLVVECRTRNFQVVGSNLTVGHLQATLSKLLTYRVLRSAQPPTLCGTGNE